MDGKVKDWHRYLPEKERQAIEKMQISSYPEDSACNRILRCLNLKQANSIKDLVGGENHDGY